MWNLKNFRKKHNGIFMFRSHLKLQNIKNSQAIHYILRCWSSTKFNQYKNERTSSLKDHLRSIHRKILTRTKISENFSCIKKFDRVQKQKIYEALMILRGRPSINKQNEDFSHVLNWFIESLIYFRKLKNIMVVFIICTISELCKVLILMFCFVTT